MKTSSHAILFVEALTRPVFLSYMKMLEKEFKSTATNIKFKAKDEGWHNFSMRVKFANGKEYCKIDGRIYSL